MFRLLLFRSHGKNALGICDSPIDFSKGNIPGYETLQDLVTLAIDAVGRLKMVVSLEDSGGESELLLGELVEPEDHERLGAIDAGAGSPASRDGEVAQQDASLADALGWIRVSQGQEPCRLHQEHMVFRLQVPENFLLDFRYQSG